jgi:hypothetical protein
MESAADTSEARMSRTGTPAAAWIFPSVESISFHHPIAHYPVAATVQIR